MNTNVPARNPYDPNTIRANVVAGIIRPRALLAILFARSVLCLSAQAVTALLFWLVGSPDAWNASVPYYYVFGSLADLGCLLILYVYLKKEGYRWRDLILQPRRPVWRDVLIGLGLFLLLFPIGIMGMSLLANLLVYGTLQPTIVNTLFARVPLWASLYSVVAWWLIWSPTESSFYNGYLFPRIEASTHHTGLTVVIVGFAWALHHVFFPLVLDWKYVIWRFLQFLVVGMVFPWLFSRLRRLSPLIVTHWLMDLTGAVMRLLLY
jgi:membrane protease YdiL (CAAX protease family)